MRKAVVVLFILLMIVSGQSFSQEQKALTKAPVKPALLVIDIQNVYLSMVPEREKLVAMTYINGLIELFRSNGYPVIRIYHFDKESGPNPGTDQFEFPTSVSIKPDDARVIKTYGDGFNKTDLDKVIKEKG